MANLWNVVILRPMLNGLIALSGALPEAVAFGLAITIFTLNVRLALTPEGRKTPSGIGLFPAPANDRDVRRVALGVAGSASVAALLRTGKGAHRR